MFIVDWNQITVYASFMLRIYSGLYKGRRLKSASSPAVRPTTAKVKLSFFDIIQEDIREAIFLDGFAGSGNIGIEALSRGAEYVVFIDELRESIKLLRHNIEKIEIPPDHFRIIKGDYNRSVIHLSKEGFLFDIIFLDPPYQLLEYANPLKVIFKRGILRKEGMVVLERPTHLQFKVKYFHCFRTQKIGQKSLDFFQHNKQPKE
jgi:16S rRNA (guanine(966)-N(2))-methyltransferase RsmD